MTGTQDREAEKAAREAAWWKRWWAEDFSWEGLGRLEEDGVPAKPWRGWSVTPTGECMETLYAPSGSRPATLQDYFRWDSDAKRLRTDEVLTKLGLLVQSSDQPVFHVLHLPPAYEDGTPTFKVELRAKDWAVMEKELARFLSRGSPTNEPIGVHPDHRAQLLGTVLRHFPRGALLPKRNARLYLSANFAAFLGKVDGSAVKFGSPTELARTMFCSYANFRSANFHGGNADFRGVEFTGGDADFASARFSGGEANFSEATFSGGDANFMDVRFSGGEAKFQEAKFSGGDAKFHKAEFSGGNASFRDAEFSGGDAGFMDAKFSGGVANFCNAKFSDGLAFFLDAEFSGGHAAFWETEFSGGPAIFAGAKFVGGRATFSSAKFSGGHSDFHEADFAGGDADFWHTEFTGGDAEFSSARFSGGKAVFCSALFSAGANFRGALFVDACEFGLSEQPHTDHPEPGAQFIGRLNFRGAYFKGLTDFSRVRFPDQVEDRNSAFEGARFFEPLDLKGVEHLPFSVFHGIRLDKGLLLDNQHPEPDQFQQALRNAEAAILRDETEDRSGYEAERSGADKRYAALEAGCRALKEAMAADGDRKREQEFFSHELAARERRLQHRLADLKAEPKGAPARRKIGPARADLMASQLYKHLSGYGGSILRPLAALGAVSLAVGAGLLALMLGFSLGESAPTAGLCLGLDCGPTLHPVVTDTLDALIRGALGPFRLLAGPGQPFAYLGDTAPVFRSLVGGIMLVHGLISSALIFLCLLALRRQFQIN